VYSIYRIYELLLRLLISSEFCFKACAGVRLVQKHRLQDVYATVLRHCQSAADQSCTIHQRCTSVISSWHQSVCQRWDVRIYTLWTRTSRLIGSSLLSWYTPDERLAARYQAVIAGSSSSILYMLYMGDTTHTFLITDNIYFRPDIFLTVW